MVATKNSHRNITSIFAVAVLLALAGCKPTGSRALVEGDKLMREGHMAEAISKLQRATELLPDEPRAWNLLAIAYHLKGEPRLALQSYRQALSNDRSNLVAIAHYNLGCLLLEQGNSSAAVDELRSYTLITNSAPGFAKLGMAQARLRQLDSAERAFATALRLDPNNIEALNGLGIIRAQRNQRDAIQYFNSALQVNPKYAPAILNAAIVAHQSSATKPAALQRYLDYLAVHREAQQVETIKHLIRQLQVELSPTRPVISSNALVHLPSPRIASVATSPPSPSSTFTNLALRPPMATNTARSLTIAVRTNTPVVTKTNQVTSAANAATIQTSLPVTVVTVTTEPVPKIALAETGDVTVEQRLTTGAVSMVTTSEQQAGTIEQSIPAAEKRGFLQRLNPFRSRPKTAMDQTPQAVVLAPPATGIPIETDSSVSSKPSFPRYDYRFPPLPKAGNRAAAERAMQQAMTAIKAGKTNEASRSYQIAIKADPSYFEAHYNWALLALQTGDLGGALIGWETALAIESDSLNARYNFALALKQGGYAHDAAKELERILEGNASDTRAHLSLANLYAQQLNERGRARDHYLKVLELDPRNAQAPAIRFWLAANP